jgi:hypothetical protein
LTSAACLLNEQASVTFTSLQSNWRSAITLCRNDIGFSAPRRASRTRRSARPKSCWSAVHS